LFEVEIFNDTVDWGAHCAAGDDGGRRAKLFDDCESIETYQYTLDLRVMLDLCGSRELLLTFEQLLFDRQIFRNTLENEFGIANGIFKATETVNFSL
jgi:hypothetical protein